MPNALGTRLITTNSLPLRFTHDVFIFLERSSFGALSKLPDNYKIRKKKQKKKRKKELCRVYAPTKKTTLAKNKIGKILCKCRYVFARTRMRVKRNLLTYLKI